MGIFYRDLANYYDQLFPLNKVTTDFVTSLQTSPADNMLDVGSATGQLVLALAADNIFKHITAVEPDEKMVQLLEERVAEHNMADRLTVLNGGMNQLDILLKGQRFQLILCLGNTLVHLQSLPEIRSFLETSFELLNKGGQLLFQIVNYTRILAGNITELPFIDKPDIAFTRHYQYDKIRHLIYFKTAMTVKASAEILEHETLLYPLKHQQVEPIISATGFNIIGCWGSFKQEPWQPDSPALVMLLKKPAP